MRIAPSRPLLVTLLLALFVANVAIVPAHAAKPANTSGNKSAHKPLNAPASTQASPLEAKARAVFEEFVRLGEAFDLALVDLYADTAKISNRRVFPDGTSREMAMPAASYKPLLRRVMPVAKEQNDISRYSDVRYTVEGGNVRISATRYSVMKDYSAPHSLLVGPDADGTWRVLEESGESRP
jgi:hypothetical protein